MVTDCAGKSPIGGENCGGNEDIALLKRVNASNTWGKSYGFEENMGVWSMIALVSYKKDS